MVTKMSNDTSFNQCAKMSHDSWHQYKHLKPKAKKILNNFMSDQASYQVKTDGKKDNSDILR